MSRRLADAQPEWATPLRRRYESELVELRAKLGTESPPLLYSFNDLAETCLLLANLCYAEGSPLTEVRAHLGCAGRAALEVLQRRGTGGGGPEGVPREYATGNSCWSYGMTAAALAIGEVELAAALAALVWDPTAAEYVGRDSVLCTTHQQRVALAFAELVLGHDERAESRLRGTTRIPEAVIGEFLMVRGLVECDRGRFADGFRRTLAWHAQVAAEPMNRRYPRYFLCVAALGHAAFAVRRGLVGVHDLPPGNVHCPLELLQT